MTIKNLEEISLEIKELLEKRRQELDLTFVEEKHIYFMKDLDGKVKSNFPSVSKIIKKFHKAFDAEGMALRMSNGDPEAAKTLQEQWRKAGTDSTNMGSRVHFELESELITRYDNYKDVRQPIYEISEEQKIKSDNMIYAGNKFLDVMHDRGAVLLGKMFNPFGNIPDNALGHYYVQLPLYGRLLNKMLEGTKFESQKVLGSVVVLLKDDKTYIEYKVPPEVHYNVYKLDLSKHIKRW